VADVPDSADADLAAFCGRKADFYLTEKRVMEKSGTRVSWNWPACLFTFAWMAYRKMWAGAALVAALSVFLNISLILAWATPALMLLLGLFGNALYLDHARRKLARVALMGETGETRQRTLIRSGGVSWPAALVAVLFSILAAITVALLWGGLFALLLGGFVWWQVLGGQAPH
jgi:hypothetical protein